MSQPRGDLYTFGFAFGVCLVCSLILASAATVLKPRQLANMRHDNAMNILSSVGYDFKELASKPKTEIFDLFDKEFDVLLLNRENEQVERTFMEEQLVQVLKYPEEETKELNSGDLLARFNSKKSLLARKAKQSLEEYDPGYKILYIHKSNGVADAYVIPIEGYGLWDIIKGYVALSKDLNTVKGISFYDHKETPGLGARITEDWFKKNFVDKKILDAQGSLVSITVAKGLAPANDLHTVDGISGATLTGQGINKFLLADLQTYEPYFKTLRSGQ